MTKEELLAAIDNLRDSYGDAFNANLVDILEAIVEKLED